MEGFENCKKNFKDYQKSFKNVVLMLEKNFQEVIKKNNEFYIFK